VWAAETHASFGAYHENLNKDRPILSCSCSAMTVTCGNIRLMWIFEGVPWTGASNDNGISENVDFEGLRAFRRWNKANIIVLFSSSSPFYWLQNTWPWMTLNDHFTLNFHCYEQHFQYLFYILTVAPIFCCITSPAEMCGSGPWSAEYLGSAEGLRIFRRRKVAGAISSEPFYLLSPLSHFTDSKTRDLEWPWVAILR